MPMVAKILSLLHSFYGFYSFIDSYFFKERNMYSFKTTFSGLCTVDFKASGKILKSKGKNLERPWALDLKNDDVLF